MGGKTQQVGSVRDVKTLNSAEQGTRADALQGVLNTAGNYNNLISSLMGGSSFNPEAATNAFLGLIPSLQGVSDSSATSSLSGYGASAQELANQTSRDALRSTADALAAGGLLDSGAANASLLEASLKPQQELATTLAGKRADAYQNTLNSLLGITGQSLTSGYNTAASSDIANTQNILAALGGQGGLFGNVADLTQQQYYTPQYAKKAGPLDVLSGIGSLAGGVGSLIGALK